MWLDIILFNEAYICMDAHSSYGHASQAEFLVFSVRLEITHRHTHTQLNRIRWQCFRLLRKEERISPIRLLVVCVCTRCTSQVQTLHKPEFPRIRARSINRTTLWSPRVDRSARSDEYKRGAMGAQRRRHTRYFATGYQQYTWTCINVYICCM